MPTELQWSNARARAKLYAALRGWFASSGFLEVETPAMVPLPGLEPHIDPFKLDGHARYLHTSPEYAMKRLLADAGCPPIFQLCKVFRDEPASSTHNPEFTMLELYRPGATYEQIMKDTEGALAAAGGLFAAEAPFERLTVREAMLRHAGVDWTKHADAASFAKAAAVRARDDDTWDDVFFRIFLDRVEPKLLRPTFITEYPASMASLARVRGDVAERVELYARGVELANGFSELNDAAEQRRRFEDEQRQRRAAGRPAFPIDERFLEAVGRMPQCSGIAVGVDRVLMLLVGAASIADVLLFPAKDF